MDFNERDSQEPKSAYPYSDYYSTGGRYRPPKRPKNYGWMVAVLGVLLLCVAAGVVLNREGAEPEGENQAPASAAASTQTPSTDTAQIAAETPAVTESEGESEDAVAQPDESTVLNGNTKLALSDVGTETLTLQDIYKKVIPSVVSITAVSDTATSSGTGIIMSEDGYIITNYHVVSDATKVTVLLTSGDQYEATRVGGDETSDLMVLKIDASGLTPAEFASSDSVQVGDSVVAIGDPLGTELRGTMTDGIISGINRDFQIGDRSLTLIQTNAALNSGNSGGPLVNMSGQVIGINTMKLTSDYSDVEGIGLAIPISSAKDIVDELLEKGYVSGRPAFGFTVETLDSRVVMFYDLPGKLYIKKVVHGSDAEKAGIESGDIITAVNGEEVETMDDFNAAKNKFSAGDTVTLTIFHKGVEVDVDVKLMDRADLN